MWETINCYLITVRFISIDQKKRKHEEAELSTECSDVKPQSFKLQAPVQTLSNCSVSLFDARFDVVLSAQFAPNLHRQ